MSTKQRQVVESDRQDDPTRHNNTHTHEDICSKCFTATNRSSGGINF